jgi:predicted RNA-binding Zn ribbon-like protein
MTTYDSAFSRPPAPPPLDLVQAFLNSVDLEDGPDAFASVASLEAWAAAYFPDSSAPLDENDRTRAIAARETLRDIVEGDESGEAVARLQRILDGIVLTMRLGEDGNLALESIHGGMDAILSRIMSGVHHAMIDGSWQRLKICHNDACRWAFYDASRNRSAVWCSMATCGSQAKARTYRSRLGKKGVR